MILGDKPKLEILDLNEHLVKKPAATYFLRFRGNAMALAGIFDGDLLIVDRSLEAENQSIVLAILNGEYVVKRYLLQNGKAFLKSEQSRAETVDLSKVIDLEICGVVTHAIKSF